MRLRDELAQADQNQLRIRADVNAFQLKATCEEGLGNVCDFTFIHSGKRYSDGQAKLASWIAENGRKRPHDLKQGIVKVGRGTGKTFTSASSYAYLHALDKTLKIFVMAGSFEQGLYLYNYYSEFLRNEDLFPSDCFLERPTRKMTNFVDGGFMRILAASETQSRAGHVDILHLDEVVLMKEELIKSVLPTIRASDRPMLVITSTASPKTSYRWFISQWQSAKRLGFKRFEWAPTECDWISDKVSRQLARLFDKTTVKVELEGGIADRQGFVFPGSSIDSCIVDPFDETVWPPESAAPLTNWHWCVDWGFTHPTVLGDLEVRSDVVYVRDVRIRDQPQLLPMLEEIRVDFAGQIGFAGNDGASEINQLKAYGMKVESVPFSTDKPLLIGELRRRFERGLIRIPDPKRLAEGTDDIDPDPVRAEAFEYLISELHQYHYDDDGKPVKQDDDTVDMLLYGMKPMITPIDRSKPLFRSAKY